MLIAVMYVLLNMCVLLLVETDTHNLDIPLYLHYECLSSTLLMTVARIIKHYTDMTA